MGACGNKELRRFMREQGFECVRARKHLIWRDANGLQIVTGASVSDRRALQNIKHIVRRLKESSRASYNIRPAGQ